MRILVYDAGKSHHANVENWTRLCWMCARLVSQYDSCFITGVINDEILDNHRIEGFMDMKALCERFGQPF